jgi:hypothetical protein
MDRRHDALARQMTALGAAMDRMVNGRTATRDEDDGDPLHGIPVGLGVYASVPAAAASLAAPGGGARPETHSLARSAEQAALGGGRPRSSHEVLGSGAASGGGRPRSGQEDLSGGAASGGGRPRSGQEHQLSRVPLPKMTFPKFTGEDPHIWRDQQLDYFTLFNIQESMWLTAATMHLSGNAAHWYRAYKLRTPVYDWHTFMEAVEAKFGASDHRQFISALLNLKQLGTVQDYKLQFEELMFKIGSHNPYYDETFFVAQFVKGL